MKKIKKRKKKKEKKITRQLEEIQGSFAPAQAVEELSSITRTAEDFPSVSPPETKQSHPGMAILQPSRTQLLVDFSLISAGLHTWLQSNPLRRRRLPPRHYWILRSTFPKYDPLLQITSSFLKRRSPPPPFRDTVLFETELTQTTAAYLIKTPLGGSGYLHRFSLGPITKAMTTNHSEH